MSDSENIPPAIMTSHSPKASGPSPDASVELTPDFVRKVLSNSNSVATVTPITPKSNKMSIAQSVTDSPKLEESVSTSANVDTFTPEIPLSKQSNAASVEISASLESINVPVESVSVALITSFDSEALAVETGSAVESGSPDEAVSPVETISAVEQVSVEPLESTLKQQNEAVDVVRSETPDITEEMNKTWKNISEEEASKIAALEAADTIKKSVLSTPPQTVDTTTTDDSKSSLGKGIFLLVVYAFVILASCTSSGMITVPALESKVVIARLSQFNAEINLSLGKSSSVIASLQQLPILQIPALPSPTAHSSFSEVAEEVALLAETPVIDSRGKEVGLPNKPLYSAPFIKRIVDLPKKIQELIAGFFNLLKSRFVR